MYTRYVQKQNEEYLSTYHPGVRTEPVKFLVSFPDPILLPRTWPKVGLETRLPSSTVQELTVYNDHSIDWSTFHSVSLVDPFTRKHLSTETTITYSLEWSLWTGCTV